MDDLYMKVARRRRRGEGGFTLIELLVVIAVLAVLAFIVIFNVSGVANRGNAAACATDVKSVQTAIDAYLNDNPTNPGGLIAAGSPVPASVWTAIVPGYLHTAPNVSSSPTYVKPSECTTTEMNVVANGTGQGWNVGGA
jgi:prepilin-type N-terminal cleavage/methylation domain-containing protein